MIDSHTHLYDAQFNEDIDDVLKRALQQDVQKMVLPNCDSTTILPMMTLTEKYPRHCFPMMGVHPCYIKENYEEELKIVETWLDKHDFFAVGEIGLDFYWDKTYIEQQRDAFRRQIKMAKHKNLPIVIHSRNATQDCIDIVKEQQDGNLKGVFHCFGDDLETAKKIVDLGFLLGIGGVVTFKNSGLPEVMKHISLAHILLETDAPYLAPTPYRGKRNESSYLSIIAQKIAEIKAVDVNIVTTITTQNAEALFHI